MTTDVTLTACYLHVKDYGNVVMIGRWIWLRYQYQTDPVRLLQAMLGGSVNAVNAWNNSALQKFTIRQIKDIALIADGAETTVTNKGNLALTDKLIGKKKSTKGKKKASRDDDGEEGDGSDEDEGEADGDMQEHGLVKRFRPSVMNPIYLIAYGTILMTSMSYKSAIGESQLVDSLLSILILLRQSICFELTTSSRSSRCCVSISVSLTPIERCSDNPTIDTIKSLLFVDILLSLCVRSWSRRTGNVVL